MFDAYFVKHDLFQLLNLGGVRALICKFQTVDPKREHIPEARPGVSTVIAPFGVSGIWSAPGATVRVAFSGLKASHAVTQAVAPPVDKERAEVGITSLMTSKTG